MTTEEERLSQIKQWWQEYRWAIIGGTALGISALGGWTGWNEYQRVQQETASGFYQDLSVAVVEGDYGTANEAMNSLLDDFPNTAYTGQGMLLMARASYENGDSSEARNFLLRVIDEVEQPATVHTARIRLAQIMIAESDFNGALDVLRVADTGSFDSHYQELRGDAYRELGQLSEAHDAYQASLNSLAAGSSYQTVLRLKLNDTLVGQ